LFLYLPALSLNAAISDGYAEEDNAMISLKPDIESFLDPDYLIMDIIVTPGSVPINAFDLTLQYDQDALKGVDLMFPTEPTMLLIGQTIDNQNGQIRISGGTPAFGIATATPIARIRFSKLADGWTTLDLPQTMVLAADGHGTSLPVLAETHKLYLYR
jgi:hypothetical protein